jgi:type I restriction enzyme S subunit
MNADALLAHYARIADAPDAIARLRRFVLDLAVRGKLVEQVEGDEPAATLLKRVEAEKAHLVRSGQIRKQRLYPSASASEYPFLLPGNWEWAALGSLAIITQGFAFASGDFSKSSADGYPLIKIGDIGSDQPDTYIKGNPDLSYLVHAGEILLGLSGSIKCAFWQGPVALLNQRIAKIAPTSEDLQIAWLFLGVQACIDQWKAETSKLTVQNIKAEQLYTALVPVPPLAEQHRIVAKVDELMALCDQLEAARAEREAVRDRFTLSTLAKLNTPDPETFGEGAHFALANFAPLTTRADQIKHLRQTILNLAVCGKLVESEASMRLGVLGQVGKFVGGSGFPKQFQGKQDMGIPFLKVSDMNLPGNERLISTANNYVSSDDLRAMRAKAHPAGTIIFPKIGGAIATNKRRILGCPSAIDNNCAGQVPNNDVDVDWLYLVLSSVDMAAYQAGTAVPALNIKQLAEHPVAIPAKFEQHRIVAKVDELMAVCDQLEASLITGEQTRSSLLEAVLHNALEPA